MFRSLFFFWYQTIKYCLLVIWKSVLFFFLLNSLARSRSSLFYVLSGRDESLVFTVVAAAGHSELLLLLTLLSAWQKRHLILTQCAALHFLFNGCSMSHPHTRGFFAVCSPIHLSVQKWLIEGWNLRRRIICGWTAESPLRLLLRDVSLKLWPNHCALRTLSSSSSAAASSVLEIKKEWVSPGGKSPFSRKCMWCQFFLR